MTDEELQACMEELYQKQQKCLKIQKRLVIATMIFFVVAFIPLLAESLIGIIWGGYLSNKATSLARKRYPYISLGPGYGGRGFSWDPWLIAEAKRSNDDMTVKILEFNRSTVNYGVAALLGCCLMWFLAALLLEILGMDFSSILP